MDLCLVRDDRRLALLPATDLDADRVRSLPRDNYPMQAQVIFTRTSKLNRWYRGIVGKVAEGIGAHPQALHNDLKLRAGLIQQVMFSQVAKNVVVVRLRSTAFPEMGDDEFSNYCDFAVPTMFADYIPGIRAAEQRKLINEWAGRRPKLEAPPKVILPR